MIKLYVYSSLNGHFLYEDTGLSGFVTQDIPANHDFTLTPPPSYEQPWYWYDKKWQSEPKQTP